MSDVRLVPNDGEATAPEPKVRVIPQYEAAEPVDLLQVAGVPVAKRLALPVAAGILTVAESSMSSWSRRMSSTTRNCPI
jgi:hypothetical protein